MARSVFPTSSESLLGISFSAKPVPPPSQPVDSTGQPIPQADGTVQPDPQNYLERVQNYIPAEIIAFFIFVNSLIVGEVGNNADGSVNVTVDKWVSYGALGFGLLACWLYAKSASNTDNNPAWKLQAFMWSIAFLIWSYAIDAKVWEFQGIELVPSLSGFLLAGFTLFSGLIIPAKAATPDPDPTE